MNEGPREPAADSGREDIAASGHRQVVAWCWKGSACGNPYMGGELRYAEGFFVDACPRCGGMITHNRRNLSGR